MSIVAICDREWLGVRRALSTITTTIVEASTANSTIQHVRPDVVVFGCYRRQWDDIVKMAHNAGARTVLTWWAGFQLNEMDSKNDSWMADSIRAAKAKEFDFIATPHRGLAETWRKLCRLAVDDFPCVVPAIEEVDVPATPLPARRWPLVGVFGSGMPWKNVQTQVAGALLVHPNTKVYMQGYSRDRRALEAMISDPTDLVVIRRIDRDAEYFRLIQSMDVNLCVSMSESFSYHAAESLLLGVPVVYSPIVRAMQDSPDCLKAGLVTDWDDPRLIAQAIKAVLLDRVNISEQGRLWMALENTARRRHLEALVAKWHGPSV